MTLNRRMTLTVAFACALTSTAVYPLFLGTAWFYIGLGAIITVAACGALSRLRTLPVVVCAAISVIGLLLYLNLVFEVRHTWVVIPTPDSIRLLWDLAGTGFTESHSHAPAAAELSGLLLLAAGGIGIVAVLTDLIAVRLRSAALAGLPLLVLFTVPVTMDAQHEGAGTAVVFCLGTVGYLAMLSADGRERIRVWGRLVSLWRSGSLYDAARRGPGRGLVAYTPPSGDGAGTAPGIAGREPGPDTRALAAAGRRVGLASIVLALCVPLIVPGLHASKLFSSGPGIGGTGGGATTPAIGLPDSLTQTLKDLQHKTTTVLTYTTTASSQLEQKDPLYLQEYVYDQLGSQGWENETYTAHESLAAVLPQAQGLVGPAQYQQVKTTVNIVDDALTNRSSAVPTFLAMPYPVAQVITPAGTWLSDPELMVFSQSPSADIQRYQAVSYAVDPTPAQLSSAPRPPASLAPDLQLPTSYQNAELKRIADQITAGKTTELGKVDALATWLSGPQFTYSASAPMFDTPAGLINFLTKSKSGVCVQSAYAMTVLTRLLGIPARLAGGFTTGSPTSGHTYVVKTDDAHAWSEVYFSGFGWLPFEATPSGGDGTARPGQYQGGTPGPDNGPPAIPGSVGTTSGATKAPSLPGFGLNRLLPNEGGQATGGPAKSAGTPWAAIALAVLAAIALACGAIAIAAPPAHRLLSAHPAEAERGPGRRRPPALSTAALVLAAAAIVALALYRLLSHTSAPDLRAGWATVGIAFGAACMAVFAAPSAGRIVVRRWRWIRAADDASLAHAAWREFHDDLQDLGLGYHPSEPPRTLAGRVAAGLPERAGEAVRRIALAEERASYAARPAGSQTLRRDAAAARRGLAASVPRGSRWRARIFPASVVTALAAGLGRAPDRLAALTSRHWTERRPAS
jgi:hypothetical protein